MRNIVIKVNPRITRDELYRFYSDNNICEAEFDVEVMDSIIEHSNIIVVAYEDETMVGFTKGVYDGVAGHICEVNVSLDYMGTNLEYDNGSIIERDKYGLGKEIVNELVERFYEMGATFISAIGFKEVENDFLISCGLKENINHVQYTIDKRPYVLEHASMEEVDNSEGEINEN